MYKEVDRMSTESILNVKIEPWAYAPKRAHAEDAGLDLKIPHLAELKPGESLTVDTGIHVELLSGTVGLLKNKSGLNINHGIVLCGDGVIDEGYTGSIKVKLYNQSDKRYLFAAGDKIAQLLVVPIYRPAVRLVDKLGQTERGDAGFGSTGK